MTAAALTVYGAARLALVLLAASWAVGWHRRERLARLLSVAGLAAMALHVWAAYHFVHGYRRADAWESVAARTESLTGTRSGAGLLANELFLAAWAADFLLRPGANRSALRWFLAFMAVNGGVVFAETWFRWLGLAVTAATAAAYLTRPRPQARIVEGEHS